MVPYFYVVKVDLLSNRRSTVFGSFFLRAVMDFVRCRISLMKIYGFTYRYLIKMYYV